MEDFPLQRLLEDLKMNLSKTQQSVEKLETHLRNKESGKLPAASMSFAAWMNQKPTPSEEKQFAESRRQELENKRLDEEESYRQLLHGYDTGVKKHRPY